jgi:cytochrome b
MVKYIKVPLKGDFMQDAKPLSIKLFHALLILSFFSAYFLADDDTLRLHAIFGVGLLFIVVLRIAIGFSPSKEYSLKQCDLSLDSLKNYAKNYFSYSQGERKNPAASWAMALVLALGILVPLSGILTLYLPEAKDVHEFFGEAFLWVVIAHIVGVIADKLFHNSSLLEAMTTAKCKSKSVFLTTLFIILFLLGGGVGYSLDIDGYEKWHEEKKSH